MFAQRVSYLHGNSNRLSNTEELDKQRFTLAKDNARMELGNEVTNDEKLE